MKIVAIVLAAAASIAASPASAKPSDPCRAPMPAGRTIDIRDARVHAQVLNPSNDHPDTVQHQIDACVATRDASVRDLRIFYIVLTGEHTPVSEDGKAVSLSAGPAFRTGNSYGSPMFPSRIDATFLRLIAVAQWTDRHGEQTEAFAVPYCVIPDGSPSSTTHNCPAR